MSQENDKLKCEDLSPVVAFFMAKLAGYPEANLRAESDRYTRILHNQMQEVLAKVIQSPEIYDKARQFQREINSTYGQEDHLLNLSEPEKVELFQFLEKNNCPMNPYLQREMPTKIVI